MTGLLELYNKNYFKTNKTKLIEAEVIDPATLMRDELETKLSDPRLNDVTSEAWNDLFKEYADKKSPDYSIIKVKDLKLKSEPSSKSGYIKYNASSTGTGIETKHKFLFFGKQTNVVDTIESGKIEVVSDAADASVFNEKDARAFIDAIKRNVDFDLKNSFLSIEAIDAKVADSASALNMITYEYFKQLCGVNDDSAELFIRNGMTAIINISRRRQAPLVGNPLLDTLANAFNVTEVRNTFEVNNTKIITLTNMLAKGMTTVSALKKLDTFKSVITFNNTLYNYSIDQIDTLFEIYSKARRLSNEEIGIAPLRALSSLNIAKHLLMNQDTTLDEPDAFSNIILGKIPDGESVDKLLEEVEELGKTVSDNGGNLLKWAIRNPNQSKLLFDRLSEESDDETDTFFLQVIRGTKLIVLNTKGALNSEESIITVDPREYKKDDVIRLVLTDWSSRENINLNDKLSANSQLFTQGELSKVFTAENKKITFNTDIKTGFEFHFAVTGSKYELFSVKLSNTAGNDFDKDDEEPTEKPDEEENRDESAAPEETINKTGLTEIEPEGRLDGDILRDVSVELGDVVTGTDGKEYQVKPETLGDGKWDIKAGTKIFRKPVDLNRLSTGKSIGDLLKSRDDFRIEYSKLTPSERAKIKSIVNPAWLPKA